MTTILIILAIVILFGWFALNCFVGLHYGVRNMRYALIEEQNIVGMIFGNLFFCLAWIIQLGKGIWCVRNSRTFVKG